MRYYIAIMRYRDKLDRRAIALPVSDAIQNMRKFLAISLWVISLVISSLGLAFGWFLRDGLKAGMVESHGTVAWQRFWDGGSLLWLLIWAVPPFAVGCFVYPLRLRKRRLHERGVTLSEEGVWPPPPSKPAVSQ